MIVSGLRFEPGSSRIRRRIANHLGRTFCPTTQEFWKCQIVQAWQIGRNECLVMIADPCKYAVCCGSVFPCAYCRTFGSCLLNSFLVTSCVRILCIPYCVHPEQITQSCRFHAWVSSVTSSEISYFIFCVRWEKCSSSRALKMHHLKCLFFCHVTFSITVIVLYGIIGMK
jgi:hypothetical protein